MNVGIIGAGLQGRRRADVLKQCQESRLVAIADVNLEAAHNLARGTEADVYSNWEEVLHRTDIEILLVCTPPNLHALVSIAAMKNGMNVMCEKPLALNTQEAEKMLTTAKANNVSLKCGFNHRHHPAIKQARSWVSEGRVGSLMYVRCRYGIGGRQDYDTEWRADPQIAGGGQLMDQGLHILDLCQWFLGEFDEVYGVLTTQFWEKASVEDNAFVILRTKNGHIAQIHTSRTEWKNLFSFEIFGRDGYVNVDGLGGSYGAERAILGERAFLKPYREEIVEFRGEDRSWYEEWQEFVASIEEAREPLGSGYDGLQALKLAGAIHESAQSGHVVKLTP